MNIPNQLREVLDKLLPHLGAVNSKETGEENEVLTAFGKYVIREAKDQALDRISQIIHEVIGEDEQKKDYDPWLAARDALRQEQRAKLEVSDE